MRYLLTWFIVALPLLLGSTEAPAAAQRRRTARPPAAPSVRPPAVPQSPGQIAGRVVRPDGLPQPDAEVVLASRTARGALVQLPWRARTAFDGRYEIPRVPPGRYLVLVRPIGADVAVAGRPDATLFPGVPTSDPGTPVDVLPGLSAEGVDIWLVPNPRRFTVSGRVFGPDATAFDSLVIEMGRPESRATDLSTVPDPGGLFTMDPVPPGPLVFRARATIGPRVLTGLATTTVAVQPVEDVRIVVRDLVPVSGRVTVEGGAALSAHLEVALVPSVLAPTPLYPAESAAVQSDGTFGLRAETGRAMVVVRGLPTGWQVLRVSPPHGATTTPTVIVPSVPVTDLTIVVGPRSSPRMDEPKS